MSKSTATCYTDNCCCCFNLRTGCFILGYVGLVGIIITTLMTMIGMGALITLGQNDEKMRDAVPIFIAITCILLFFLVLALAFNIVLLVGLHKNKPGHVKAYLIYNTIFVVIYTILLIVFIACGFADVSTIITRIIQILFSVYFLVVIRSHYIDMKEPSNQKV